MAGPDNPSGSVANSGPAASRTLPPEVAHAIALLAALRELGLGSVTVGAHGVPVELFDALAADPRVLHGIQWYPGQEEFWTCEIVLPAGDKPGAASLCFFTRSRPAGWNPTPQCVDCGCELRQWNHRTESDACFACERARIAEASS